jgi:NADPH2:quinone reductase
MRAVRFHEVGGPEVLRVDEVPDPEPGTGQVLITVAASGVNYADVQWRSGKMEWTAKFMPPLALPVIPGYEVAGTVTALGDGVDAGLLGRRVVSVLAGRSGGYAELAVVDAAGLLTLPDDMSENAAVTVFAQGSTALVALEAAAVKAGETVLVEGAAGGIGTLLVQLAKKAGATVVAAARGAEKLELARRLGADVAVDYGTDDWPERVGGEVDVVFDLAGGRVTEQAFGLLRRVSGRMVIYGVASGEIPDVSLADIFSSGVSVISAMGRLYSDPAYQLEKRAAALRLIADSAVEPVTGQVVPFAEAPRAHQRFADRTAYGKTILVP